MPTYSYKCNKCKKQFNVFQKMSDPSIEECKSVEGSICKGKLTRLISGGSGMIFKGSGFYLTDYVKNDKKNKKQASKRDQKQGNLKDNKKGKNEKNEQNKNSKSRSKNNI